MKELLKELEIYEKDVEDQLNGIKEAIEEVKKLRKIGDKIQSKILKELTKQK